MDGLYEKLFGIASVSKKTRLITEDFVIKNPDDPKTKKYFEGLGRTAMGRIRINELVKAQIAYQQRNLYPFIYPGTRSFK